MHVSLSHLTPVTRETVSNTRRRFHTVKLFSASFLINTNSESHLIKIEHELDPFWTLVVGDRHNLFIHCKPSLSYLQIKLLLNISLICRPVFLIYPKNHGILTQISYGVGLSWLVLAHVFTTVEVTNKLKRNLKPPAEQKQQFWRPTSFKDAGLLKINYGPL